MSRSLNKITLIGNLTRDPELRYTPQGTAVCSFGLATNRQWVTDGEKKEEAEFHNIVVWAGLAEIAAKYLSKGRQAYVEGRIATREWETQTGEKRRTTEIIASDIIFLSGGPVQSQAAPDIAMDETHSQAAPAAPADESEKPDSKPEKKSKKSAKEAKTDTPPPPDDDDIPF